MDPKTKRKGEKGQTLIILALAMGVLFGFVALATDGGMIYAERRRAQNGGDASSLAGGAAAALSLENSQVVYTHWNCSDSRIYNAENLAVNAAINRAGVNEFVIDNNVSDHNGATAVCGQQDNGSYIDKYIDVTTYISNTIQTYFARFVYPYPFINNVQAVTRVRPRTPMAFGNAIVATRNDCPNSDTGGVHFDGNNQVRVIGGGIFSNACIRAGGSVDVNVTGGTGITCVGAGCYHEAGSPAISPAVDSGPITMPRVSFEVPPPVCSGLPSGSMSGPTIHPGRYGDVNIQNSDEFTMSPGLYCFRSLTMNGGKLSGTGVTIYITHGDLDITGGEINLVAPPQRNCAFCPAALPGVLMYLASGNTGEISLLGNGNSDYLGLIYAPDGTIEVGGTGDEVSPIHAQLIADTVKIHGNAELLVTFDDQVTAQRPATLELYK